MSSDQIRKELAAFDGIEFDRDVGVIFNGETTDPYGLLAWTIGSDDDFYCFDYLVLPGGYIAIHSVINSETGSFIMDGDYEIAPYEQAHVIAAQMIDRAWTWCYDNAVFIVRRPTDDGEGERTGDEQASQESADRFLEAIKNEQGAIATARTRVVPDDPEIPQEGA